MPAEANNLAFAPKEPKGAKPLEHESELVAARFSPCGKFVLAAGFDAGVHRWELASGKKSTFAGHQGWVQSLAFHPDGKRLFSADSWGTICAWDYAADEPKPLWTKADCHRRWMRAMSLKNDGTLLATCGADRVVRTWNTKDGAAVWESPVQAEDLFSLAFAPHDATLLVGDLKGHITEWDLKSHKPARTLDASPLYLRPIVQGVREINDVGGARGMAFDRTGKWLAVSGSQPATSGFFTGKPTILLFDFASGKREQMLQWDGVDPSEGITFDVQWHPDGFVIAGSSGQPGKGALYAWKPGDTSPLLLNKSMAHCRSVSLHPDGKRLAVTQVLLKPGGGAGNGRKLNKDGAYDGLISRVRLMDV